MECIQCGRCCRVIAMKAVGMSPEVIDYLIKRGANVDDGYILLPHRCQHLRLDEKKSIYKVEDDGTRVLLTPRYKCDIHNTADYPVLCKRFHGHGNYYIPDGCVFITKEDEENEHNIYLKSFTRKLTRQKSQRVLVKDEEG